MHENSHTEKPVYQRTWVVVLAVAALLFLLVLVAIPYGISYGLQQWLLANGGEDVQLEDIDFNIFNGKATITDLHVIEEGAPRLVIPKLELDVDWMPLFSKHVQAMSIRFDGMNIEIVQAADGSLRIGGISLPAGGDEVEETTETLWGFGLEELQVTNTTISYKSPDIELVTHFNELTLGHLVTWTTDPARLAMDATINDAPVTLDGELPPLSDGFGFNGKLRIQAFDLQSLATLAASAVDGLSGRFSLDSELNVLFTTDNSLTVSHSGQLALDELALEQAGRQVSYAALRWQGDTAVSMVLETGELDLKLQGTVAGKELGVTDETLQLGYATQGWTGTLTLATAAGGNTNINLQGKLTGNDLAVLVPAENLNVRNGSFLWDGTLTVDSGEQTAVAAEGVVQLGSLGADSTDTRINLAAIEDVSVERLGLLENGDLSITGLAITNAVFAKEGVAADSKQDSDGSILSAGLITADSIQVTAGNQVAIGKLEWRDVVSLIQREADGVWRPVRIISTLPFAHAETDAGADAPPPTAATDAPAGRVRVDEIKITGDSAIILDDKTVKPPFNMRLTITEAVMTDIDNGQPDLNSPLSIKARISKHSHVTVKGTMQPFAERPTLDLKNHVDGISLPQLSAYTIEALGYALESGHLDADSTLKINKGKIDAQNKLVIRGLELTPVDNESREKLDGQLTVPLNTALSMLRDDNDTIKLNLPVKGDIDSPDFDISDIINTAVSKALMAGSMTYLKLALQPYGALITVAQLAGEAATKVRLQPVNFEPGQAVPQAEADGYLQKVAGIMKDRPEINIKICGLAVVADGTALAGGTPAKQADSKDAAAAKGAAAVSDEQLIDLATQRAAYVKDRLVIKHGVTASRLVACTPHIDDAEDDDNVPRVDLLI